jgi:hypothetical protein
MHDSHMDVDFKIARRLFIRGLLGFGSARVVARLLGARMDNGTLALRVGTQGGQLDALGDG